MSCPVRHFALLLLAPLALAAGCKRAAAPGEAPPPQVTVARPVRQSITEYREYTGNVAAVESVEVRPRVQGLLEKIEFKEGVEVKKGDPLYQIDPKPFEAVLAQARADVVNAEAQLQLTKSEADRGARLLGTGGISPEEYSQRVAARNQAQAALDKNKAVVETARLNLGYTKITAPIAGRIGRTLVTEGNLVGYSQPPTLLTTIARTDPMYVYFEAPERDYLEYQHLLQKEQGLATAETGKLPLSVGLENESDYPHGGTLDFRDNAVDPGTGTILLRGGLPNPRRVLTPGLFARVRVPFGKPRERLLVPEAALAANQKGRYLLVVNADDAVEMRQVEVGQSVGGLIVVTSGLKADDWVIVNGTQRARTGSKVAPERTELPAAPAP